MQGKALIYQEFEKVLREKISDEFDWIYTKEWFEKNYTKATNFKIPIYYKNNFILNIYWSNLKQKRFKKFTIKNSKHKKLALYRFLIEAKEKNLNVSKIDPNCLTSEWFEKNFTTKEKTKLILFCEIHGSYQQTISQFLKGKGCRKCSNAKNAKKLKNTVMNPKKVTFQRIQEKIEIINKKYNKNYKLLFGEEWFKKNYKNQRTELDIYCPEHGDFKTTWFDIRDERKLCKKCFIDDKKLDFNTFIKKYKNKLRTEDFEYFFDENDFKKQQEKLKNLSKIKIKIKCKKCNKIFKQKINNHFMIKQGCPYCNPTKLSLKEIKKRISESLIKTLEIFYNKKPKIKLITKLNDDWYQNYKGINNEFLEFYCEEHGKYKKPIYLHNLKDEYRYLCPKCSQKLTESFGERLVKKVLEELNIYYTTEWPGFENNYCINSKTGRKLKFDFYIPRYNLIIEYDGIQHFDEKYQIKDGNFEDLKFRDNLKNNYCKKNNLKLLRIPYWINSKEEIKKEILNKLNIS